MLTRMVFKKGMGNARHSALYWSWPFIKGIIWPLSYGESFTNVNKCIPWMLKGQRHVKTGGCAWVDMVNLHLQRWSLVSGVNLPIDMAPAQLPLTSWRGCCERLWSGNFIGFKHSSAHNGLIHKSHFLMSAISLHLFQVTVFRLVFTWNLHVLSTLWALFMTFEANLNSNFVWNIDIFF